MEYSDVKEKFNENASEYDSQRRKLIPCFNDFYSVAVSLVKANNNKPDILDIGAGTGLLSSFIMDKLPNTKLTLIDISEKMIEIAKKRHKDKSAVTYIIDDYTKYNFDRTYDVVVSSLSIHHLADNQKRELYANIFSILNPNGIFINADQVLGNTLFIESLYKSEWKLKVDNSGLSQYEIHSAYERTKLDKMATLDDQLTWLKEIGFLDVDCVYKYYNFAVIFARK
jgi:tRNA (cmo5U34)-methyltransferase